MDQKIIFAPITSVALNLLMSRRRIKSGFAPWKSVEISDYH